MYNSILAKKNWVVIGASENSQKYGCKIYKRLKNEGYNVYGVNPGLETIFGEKCYKSVKDIPEKPDVINVVVPPKAAMEVAKEVAESGIKYFWLQPGANTREVIDCAESLGLEVINACVLVELYNRHD